MSTVPFSLICSSFFVGNMLSPSTIFAYFAFMFFLFFIMCFFFIMFLHHAWSFFSFIVYVASSSYLGFSVCQYRYICAEINGISPSLPLSVSPSLSRRSFLYFLNTIECKTELQQSLAVFFFRCHFPYTRDFSTENNRRLCVDECRLYMIACWLF